MSRLRPLRAGNLSLGGGNSGFLLLEVMAAAVLLAVLIVPLTTGALAALGAADAVRGQGENLAVAVEESNDDEAWGWGPRVVCAAWTPGPVLDLSVQCRGDVSLTVGVWVDGWLLGEFVSDPDGSVSLRASEWAGAEGRELTVRARQGEGVWGAPWRSVVASIAGEAPRLTMIDATPAGDGASLADHDPSVVHTPALANPEVRVNTAVEPFEVGPLGLPLLIGPSGAGRCDLGLGSDGPEERAQSWYAEKGRAVDLYF